MQNPSLPLRGYTIGLYILLFLRTFNKSPNLCVPLSIITPYGRLESFLLILSLLKIIYLILNNNIYYNVVFKKQFRKLL